MSKVTVTAEYEGHPVIVGDHTMFRYNEKHLNNNLELLESCVDRHNKVFAWKMDVRMPKDKNKVKVEKEPNKFISDFMSAYTNKLAREGLDPDYVVKMEQKTSEQRHFHTFLLVDGNKVKDQEKYCRMGERLIEKQLGMEDGAADGLIDFTDKSKQKKLKGCKDREQAELKERRKHSYMIRRDSPSFQEQFDACYRRMSYLAKDDVNDIIPSSERKVFYSRYNRKKCRRKN